MALVAYLFLGIGAVLAVAYLLNRVQTPPPRKKSQVIRTAAPDRDPNWRQLCSWAQDIVGEQYHKPEIMAWEAAPDRALEVVREPQNPHDPNAIAIFGVWDGGSRRGHLGYLPRELAADIAATRPVDMPLKAVPFTLYKSGDFRDLKVRLLEPSARSEFWKSRGGAPPQLGRQSGRTI